MKNYGLQRSAVEPKAVEITESKVWYYVKKKDS